MTDKRPVRSFDVVYDPEIGLHARLYLPDRAPIGAMVDIHGGGWCTGSRLDNAIIAQVLADAGIVVMSPEFRMPPAQLYPVSICDVHLAIRWLKSIISTFGLAPECVGGLGTSSGGHQLLLAALRPNDQRYAALHLSDQFGHEDSTISFLVLGWPVVDPLERYKMVLENQNKQLIDCHDAYWPDEASMAEGNPQRLLDAGTLGPLPPALILQGTADPNLPANSTDRFVAAYRKAGGNVSLSMFADQPHAFVTRTPESEAAQKAMKMIVDFAVNVIKKRLP